MSISCLTNIPLPLILKRENEERNALFKQKLLKGGKLKGARSGLLHPFDGVDKDFFQELYKTHPYRARNNCEGRISEMPFNSPFSIIIKSKVYALYAKISAL